MNRPTTITVAAVLQFVVSLVGIALSIPVLALGSTGSPDEPPFWAMVIGLALNVAGVIAAYGLWRNQRWGKVLTIFTRGADGLFSLPGVFFAPTSSLMVAATASVVLAIVIIALVLWPTGRSVAVQG